MPASSPVPAPNAVPARGSVPAWAHTCLRCKSLGRPLTMLSSHTHTTALAPEVTTVVGVGHTAHRQRPQAARFSNVIRICGKWGMSTGVGLAVARKPGQSDGDSPASLGALGSRDKSGVQDPGPGDQTQAIPGLSVGRSFHSSGGEGQVEGCHEDPVSTRGGRDNFQMGALLKPVWMAAS